MMKRGGKSERKIFGLLLAAAMLLSVGVQAASADTLADIEKPAADFDIPANLAMDWSGSTLTEQVKHHSYAE